MVCRAWIPAGGPSGAPAPLVCVRCRTRLIGASWPRCPRCHAPSGTGRSEAPDCIECREWPAELTRARYAHVLEPPATDLVHALKYEGWRELADFMGAVMARTAVRHVDGVATGRADDPPTGRADDPPTGAWIVVPVPTTIARVRARGYNQAGLLADEVARRLDLPTHDALGRRRSPASQTTLSPRERRENVRGAFAPGDSVPRGARVLLVDDVLTTGATAGEAARVLRGAGAGPVTLLTFGRALPRSTSADER